MRRTLLGLASTALFAGSLLLTGCDQSSKTTTTKKTETTPGGSSTTTTTETNRKVDVETKPDVDKKPSVRVDTDRLDGPKIDIETKQRKVGVDVGDGKVDVNVK